MQDLISELVKLRPGAARVMMGQHEVFRHHDQTPAHEFDSVIKLLDGPRLIELTARDSFDDRLAEFLLDRIAEQALPGLRSGRIRVLSTLFPEPWVFECIVVVPPTIAGRFEHESSRLRRVTYWVVPGFATSSGMARGARRSGTRSVAKMGGMCPSSVGIDAGRLCRLSIDRSSGGLTVRSSGPAWRRAADFWR